MAYPRLTRLVVENYKSIRRCSVSFEPLTYLVGPNGAGKSNLLDCLAFVGHALRDSLRTALLARGAVLFLPYEREQRPEALRIRVESSLSTELLAHYEFELVESSDAHFEVAREQCEIVHRGKLLSHFSVRKGVLESTSLGFQHGVEVGTDRLFLTAASLFDPMRQLFAFLSNFVVYNPEPATMRAQSDVSRPPVPLSEDGSNYEEAFYRMQEQHADVARVIQQYLSTITRVISWISARTDGEKQLRIWALEAVHKGDEVFQRVIRGSDLSFGTLRALAILIAVFQPTNVNGVPATVCIEEPEAGLHPYAARVLRDAFREASDQRQLIISSHSPEILDDRDIAASSLRAVVSVDGATVVGPIGPGVSSLLKDGLFTAGELLRDNRLTPDEATVADDAALDLFATFKAS